MFSTALIFASIIAVARAQQVGTNTAEVHPALTVSKCTASGCTTSAQSIVLDANWRWLHSTVGYTNCYTGNTWSASLCPDAKTCAANCALDGGDYAGTYGITTTGNNLKLQLVTGSGATANSGSRTYLMAAGSTTKYEMLKLLNAEFTFDVDVSNLPCGLNGALYLSEMQEDGGMAAFPTNKAGAAYGTGYCDAQCPRDLKFINGEANSVGWNGTSVNAGTGQYGSCCNEMDIWEANSLSTAYTPHPCSVDGPTRCAGADCGIPDRSTSLCDAAGCDYNSYRMGDPSFYGPGKTIDSTKKFTVVTQFLTDSGTATGTLTEIKRYYVQNGVVYANSASKIAGVTGNSLTDTFCANQKTAFADGNQFKVKGGMATMSKALAKGMVLVMSIWDDTAAKMLWLDAPYPVGGDITAPGVVRGTCAANSGDPATIEATQGSSNVQFSNIKWGPINSTFTGTSGTPVGPGSSSSSVLPTKIQTSTTSATTTAATTAPTTVTTSAKPSSTGGAGVAKWGQCGGQNYAGPTNCVSGSTCKFSNPYYSQCL